MRIDEIQQHQGNVNRFGGMATPLAYLSSPGGPPPEVPPRNQSTNHRTINMPECEPLLPPPPPPPRNNSEQTELAWPRMIKVYPSDRRTSPVKRTHSDRVTPTREVLNFNRVSYLSTIGANSYLRNAINVQIPFRPRNFRMHGSHHEGNSHRLRGRNMSETSLSHAQQHQQLSNPASGRPHHQAAAPVPYSSVDDISSRNHSSGDSSSDESPSEISHSNEPPSYHLPHHAMQKSPADPHSHHPNQQRIKEQNQKSGSAAIPGNLSVLKEICAGAASSDGLYDSTVGTNANFKLQKNPVVGVSHASTNYMGDSCTSFEFLSNSKGHSTTGTDTRGGEDYLFSPASSSGDNAVVFKEKGNSSTGGSNGGHNNHKNHRKGTPNSGANSLHESQTGEKGQQGEGSCAGSDRGNCNNADRVSNNGDGGSNNGDGGSSAPSTGNRKDSSCQTEKSYVKGNRISDFEKEIKKLLERQHLPQVDELASVQKVLSVMGKLR